MIELRNVRKRYPGQKVPALRGIYLRVLPGEFVFLVGPSGSGKSTLLRILHAGEEADSGIIRVAGYNVMHLRPREIPYYRRKIGMVFQDFKLIQTRTARENLVFAMRATGAPEEEIRTRVSEVLEQVRLEDRQLSYPDELSGGEQQRLAVARAILTRPQLLLADEPTGNLDPTLSLEIMRLFEEINAAGTTVLVVTHEQNLVNEFQKRVIHLKLGRVISDEESGTY